MGKSLVSTVMIALMFSTLRPAPVVAQERKGAIAGHVTDTTHAVVQGARVELQPAGQNAVSDGQGQFSITGLAAGHYTLTVSAVGFASFSSNDLAVTPGGLVNVDATLQVEARSEVVEVRAEREHGEVEALNRERTADNILEVLPAEVITSLPNTNVADAVGRLNNVSLERDEGEGKYIQIRGTEPRMSNVTVDGVHLPSPENVRNVKLDAVPADLVESVELSKTLSANQEGDAIGGSVNLVTKSAGNQPYVSVVGMGGLTPIAGGRSLNQFDLTLGNRFFGDHRLGVLVGGGYDWNGRGIDDVEPSPDVNPLIQNGVQVGTFSGANTYDQREYWYDRTRFGLGGTLDYRLSNTSSAYLRGLFSQFKDDGQDWIYSPSVGSFNTATLTNPDGSSSFTHVTRKPAQRLFSTQAGARHDWGRNLLNYEVAFGQARFTGFFPTASFDPVPNSIVAGGNGTTIPGVQYAVNTQDPFVPVLTALNANIFDTNQYVLHSIRTGDTHVFERDATGTISLSRTYNAGSHFSVFDIGFKVRDAHKSELATQTTFVNTNDATLGGAALMSSFPGTFTNPNYYFGKYGTFGPTTDYKKIAAFYNANPNFFTPGPSAGPSLSDLARTLPSDFNADERVTAGYIMNTINFGAARLQGGVRLEGTSASFLANQINRQSVRTSLVQVPGSQSYIDVLPSVHFQYRFGQDTIFRLAYGMGIARPNFGDLPPHISFDPTVKAPKAAVSAGNPNLNPTHAQNFDVLIERYLKPFGVIEGGFFYKYLTDPIYNANSPLTTGPFAGNVQNQPINGPRAHITGFEMAWQQRLSFLPGFLNGSGVRANYSWTTSQATFPVGAFVDPLTGASRTDQPALQRQAPNNWNLDYTYDKKGVSARLGLTHNDANIFSYGFRQNDLGGLKGPKGDTYLYPHTQVDVQASYWIPRSHGFQIVGYVLNLTNEVFGFYQGSEQFDIQREYYNRTYALGLRWTLGRENK
jgi:TonB-dependent receptor